MSDSIKEKYFQRVIKSKANLFVPRISIQPCRFFTFNKKLGETPPQKQAEANPAFVSSYIEEETKKLPAYIQRKLARQKKNDLL